MYFLNSLPTMVPALSDEVCTWHERVDSCDAITDISTSAISASMIIRIVLDTPIPM